MHAKCVINLKMAIHTIFFRITILSNTICFFVVFFFSNFDKKFWFSSFPIKMNWTVKCSHELYLVLLLITLFIFMREKCNWIDKLWVQRKKERFIYLFRIRMNKMILILNATHLFMNTMVGIEDFTVNSRKSWQQNVSTINLFHVKKVTTKKNEWNEIIATRNRWMTTNNMNWEKKNY